MSNGLAADDADFVHIAPHSQRTVGTSFFKNSSGKRVFTEGIVVSAITDSHPNHHLTISPAYSCDLLAFAAAYDDVSCVPCASSQSLLERMYQPPARRFLDDDDGNFLNDVVFGCFEYAYNGKVFLVYIAEGGDGAMMKRKFNYILVPPSTESLDEEDEAREMTLAEKMDAQKNADLLIAAASKWTRELHNEIWVFDNGYWDKNRDLWRSIQKSNWEDVILDEGRKKAIIDDVVGFFDAEERYAEFGVPWKRGVIFYGPPGNGKTISTKALMHDLSKAVDPKIESLYVKSFNSYMGPEQGIRQIFQLARNTAPCILIFEDIDALITPNVRSYFLNEVDGLESNHGILMVGSTNHLQSLDPGIAKRPSRFDRKYLFDDPNLEERVQYSEYWRQRLDSNKKIDFPRPLSTEIAKITDDFSFAYMKEAFVATLLVIVGKSDEVLLEEKGLFENSMEDIEGNFFWKEIQRQIENLRNEMGNQAKPLLSSGGIANGRLGHKNLRSSFGVFKGL